MERKYLKLRKKLLNFCIRTTILFASIDLGGKIENFFNNNNIKAYNEIVDDFSDFLKENGVNCPNDIYDYYNYALWNGYLSNDKHFKYSNNHALHLDNYGIECINGKGVCLNEADLLTDIFKSFGYDAFTINCYVDTNYNYEIKLIRNQENITRSIDTSNPSNEILTKALAPITKLTGNHSITCVKYNNEYLFFDPTQLAYLEKNEDYKVGIINGKGEYTLKYFSSIIYNDMIAPEVMFSTSKKNYKNEILNHEAIDINIEALNNFYNEHKDKYNYISEDSKTKYSYLISILSILSSMFILNFTYSEVLYLLESCKNKYNSKKVNELVDLINNLLDENNINNLSNKPATLYEIIKNSNLELDEKEDDIPFYFNSIVNNNKANFMKKVLDNNFETYLIKINKNLNYDIKHYILAIKIDDNYYFYDCERNIFLSKITEFRLFDGENTFLIYPSEEIFHKNITKYISNQQDVDTLNSQLSSISNAIIEKFYNNNKKLIDSLPKRLNFKKEKNV